MKIEESGNISKSAVEIDGASGVGVRWLISKADGAKNFAMRMFELEVGGHTPLHTHRHEHEVFVLEGEGVFVCEGQEYRFGREYVIFVPGGKEHCFKNAGDCVLRFLCIIPGEAA